MTETTTTPAAPVNFVVGETVLARTVRIGSEPVEAVIIEIAHTSKGLWFTVQPTAEGAKSFKTRHVGLSKLAD